MADTSGRESALATDSGKRSETSSPRDCQSGSKAPQERPIIMSAPMVRAIMDGRKTQTRRVLKQATGPSLSVDMDENEPGTAELSWLHGAGPGYDVHETIKRVRCPYGKPGDRLWVRETFAYEADEYEWTVSTSIPAREGGLWYAADGVVAGSRWKPSIHMPREFSRITLEITDVRVQRLQEISAWDCYSEGIEQPEGPILGSEVTQRDNARGAYRKIWDSLNAKRGFGWDTNPWVWAITFRQVQRAFAEHPELGERP